MKLCVVGIKGVFSAHGNTLNGLYLNKNLKKLLDNGVFERIIFLNSKLKRGQTDKVYYFTNKKEYEILKIS